MLPLESMLLTPSVLSTLPRGLLMLMLTMVDMESTLDPRHLVSPPSLMLDSLCRDMPPDMAMEMDTMARGLLMLMLTMVDMESTLDPRLLVSPPSLMLDSLCRDMPPDMAMDSD